MSVSKPACIWWKIYYFLRVEAQDFLIDFHCVHPHISFGIFGFFNYKLSLLFDAKFSLRPNRLKWILWKWLRFFWTLQAGKDKSHGLSFSQSLASLLKFIRVFILIHSAKNFLFIRSYMDIFAKLLHVLNEFFSELDASLFGLEFFPIISGVGWRSFHFIYIEIIELD